MLQINELTYAYEGKKLALKNISMDFNKGEIIGLIGRNGSGKSTLFLNIVGVFINQWLLLTRMPAAESMARGSHRMRF